MNGTLSPARSAISRRRTDRRPTASLAPPRPLGAIHKIAANFAALTGAEMICRAASVLVTLALTRRLGTAGNGRIEFCFNVVFWLVLLVRDGLEVIAAREIARHGKLVRSLVGYVLAVKGLLATFLYIALSIVGGLTIADPAERSILQVYGLLLFTTAMGLDFVYRGTERMGLIAGSLIVRAAVYSGGVGLLVFDSGRIVWVPAFLVAGEAIGISLVWWRYVKQYGRPRLSLRGLAPRVLLKRGGSIYLIQIAQAVIGSIDLLIVGLLSRYQDIGLYCIPHRMAMFVLTFGLIAQQAIFPALSRGWRDRPDSARQALDASVRFLVLGMLPLAVGTTILADPLIRFLHLPADYQGAGRLLALGIWRAPILTLAYLYQTSLIAWNKERLGVGLLVGGAIAAAPLVGSLGWSFGNQGAAVGVVLVALGLLVAGYILLAREARQPAWHHHLFRPAIASAVMVPVCLLLRDRGVWLAVPAGASIYFAALYALGGIGKKDLQAIIDH